MEPPPCVAENLAAIFLPSTFTCPFKPMPRGMLMFDVTLFGSMGMIKDKLPVCALTFMSVLSVVGLVRLAMNPSAFALTMPGIDRCSLLRCSLWRLPPTLPSSIKGTRGHSLASLFGRYGAVSAKKSLEPMEPWAIAEKEPVLSAGRSVEKAFMSMCKANNNSETGVFSLRRGRAMLVLSMQNLPLRLSTLRPHFSLNAADRILTFRAGDRNRKESAFS